MQQALEINLTKRKGKRMLSLAFAISIILIFFVMGSNLIKSFDWLTLVIVVGMAVGGYFIIEDVIIAFRYNSIKLLVENPGSGIIKITCLGDNVKVLHETEEIKVADIRKIYILKKKTNRGLTSDKTIEYTYIENGRERTKTLEIIPDLLEASDADFMNIFVYVKQLNPSISIGY